MGLRPNYRVGKLLEIPLSFLKENGIQGLILDVDNTLTSHNNPEPEEKAVRWLEDMRLAGIALIIVSNNTKERVTPFAKRLGLPFVAWGKKPLTSGIRKACRRMGLAPSQVGVVGDQIFTDIWGANRSGCVSILVEPIQLEDTFFFHLKRRWEKPFTKGPSVTCILSGKDERGKK